MKRMDPIAPGERTVPIVMAFDPGFLMPSAVTMISVLENGNEETRYIFFVLTEPEYANMDRGLFDCIASRYPNFSYEYIYVEDKMFSETRLPMHVTSKLTFARMLIPISFPALDYCIYLDGDVIARQDIGLLWEMATEYTALDTCYLMAAPDLSLQNGQGAFFERFRQRLGWDNLNNYFNSGVLVMNLRKLREDHMLENFQSHADKEYYFGDQDILNVCCRGKTAMLPVRWNMYPGNIGDESMLRTGCTALDKADIMSGYAAILHFAGADKPWKCIETFWEHEWFRYARLLPRMSMTEEYLEKLRRMDRYDSTEDRTDAVRNAQRYILYGYTDVSRKLLDRLETRKIGTPWYFCDSNPEKIGKSYRGIDCISREGLLGEITENTLIILCGQSAWREIRQELLQCGVPAGQMIRYRKRDFALVSCEKEYNVGLLMGVFDLFHIGHLNLIRRAKAQCRYLRIGVLSDDLVYEFKHFRPTIPQNERMEILRALRDVDEVVLLEEKDDVSRINEWKKRPFDCFFSGDDYQGNPYWEWEKQELNKLGSDIVFFPYTKEQSSTMIRCALQKTKKETDRGNEE